MIDAQCEEKFEEVNIFNEREYREKFSKEIGHTMDCIDETITDMAIIFAKVCSSFAKGGIPDQVLASMDVEQFDEHIRKILETKECNCKILM
jgi:hypothetical protein